MISSYTGVWSWWESILPSASWERACLHGATFSTDNASPTTAVQNPCTSRKVFSRPAASSANLAAEDSMLGRVQRRLVDGAADAMSQSSPVSTNLGGCYVLPDYSNCPVAKSSFGEYRKSDRYQESRVSRKIRQFFRASKVHHGLLCRREYTKQQYI